MTRFTDALESNPAITALGDISIRYEPSLLIGEARATKTLRPTLALLLTSAFAVTTIGVALTPASSLVIGALVTATALSVLCLLWLTQFEKRHRRFVLNFATQSLRLDFTTPVRGRARTQVVHFDAVRAVELFEQADGAGVLTVDFAPSPDANELLREVLAASISSEQGDTALRLRKILRDAFGLSRLAPGENALVGQ